MEKRIIWVTVMYVLNSMMTNANPLEDKQFEGQRKVPKPYHDQENLEVIVKPTETLLMANSVQRSLRKHDIESFDSFKAFIQTYSKHYESEDEVLHRFRIFQQTLDRINSEQGQYPLAQWGITRFADLTPTEFIDKYTGGRPMGFHGQSGQITPVHQPIVGNQPPSYDWRNYNGVSSVKDQGECGCCYAFLAIGAVESQQMIHNGVELSFSPQELVSCSKEDPYTNKGCDSGDQRVTVYYILQVGGVTTEQDYPYVSGVTGEAGQCEPNKPRAFKLSSSENLPKKNDDYIGSKVYESGPVMASLDSAAFQDYQSGIVDVPEPANGWNLTHGLLIVGYGEENGVRYWIGKNSWGPSFGEDGYARVVRGKNCLAIEEYVSAVYA